LERLILNREGISRKDDSIPQRLKIEPLPDGMAKGHKIAEEDFSEMLNEYYLERGWSVDGKVTKKTANQFEIP
jgi:aldehyde:ferredoxin oxidoreductase